MGRKRRIDNIVNTSSQESNGIHSPSNKESRIDSTITSVESDGIKRSFQLSIKNNIQEIVNLCFDEEIKKQDISSIRERRSVVTIAIIVKWCY